MHQGNAQQTTNDSNLITLHICTARLHNFFNSARTLSEQPALGALLHVQNDIQMVSVRRDRKISVLLHNLHTSYVRTSYLCVRQNACVRLNMVTFAKLFLTTG